ncbi:MAG TPA: phosphogluconate dehydratase [Rhodocyclaceae bacterium]|nr:phosphogluconate dehydratase [Rhodocyclaceae bacterium]
MPIHPTLASVTERIRTRSASTRQAYLQRLDEAARAGPSRRALSCTNLAHGFAAAPMGDKIMLREQRRPNLAIVSSYNDMLSAHQPMQAFPAWIKEAAREAGATAQFAGGVPAMCDGVTQGQPGMELSLFSRDVIAMSTAVALSHNMFDATLCLGVCDKIVPGLLIGALAFGHLPAIFIPAGPMGSGLPNKEKAAIRQRYAAGEIGKAELLEAEARAYHSAGTCTFYGTANSNQMLMEVMGLHLPGAAFVPPGTALREALTREAARQAVSISREGGRFTPVGRMIDERSIVNAIVALLATGGSTNHTLHLVAIARAAGIVIDWNDFGALSACVPLLARVYPNGGADVNAFHAAGGTGYLIGQLLDGGLVHEDVDTVVGHGLSSYRTQPALVDGRLEWRASPAESRDTSVLVPLAQAFSRDGGLKVLDGNLGRAVTKVSAVSAALRVVEAPAKVFDSQEGLIDAYARGALEGDFVAVVRFQGPRANGMPELHGLTPTLANLLDNGQRVALVTDGRMSGASGKVPAAIHVTPEACDGGPLARVRDGDIIRIDAETGVLEVKLSAAELARRQPAQADLASRQQGMGRELFGSFRATVSGAESGAMSFGFAA